MKNQQGYVDILVPLVLLGAIVLTLGLIVLIVMASAKERAEWDEFASSHNCKLVATKQGTVSSGVGTAISGNGQVSVVPVTAVSAGQDAFLCDDGVTYWRNK